MSPVEFEEQMPYQTNDQTMVTPRKKPLFIRWGIVKNERQLVVAYLSIIVILLSVSIFIIYTTNKTKVLPYNKIPESTKAKLPPDAYRIFEQQHANER